MSFFNVGRLSTICLKTLLLFGPAAPVGRLSRIVGTPFSMWGGSPEPPVREADTLRSKDQGHAFNERSMSLCGVSDKEKRGAARRAALEQPFREAG